MTSQPRLLAKVEIQQIITGSLFVVRFLGCMIIDMIFFLYCDNDEMPVQSMSWTSMQIQMNAAPRDQNYVISIEIEALLLMLLLML